MERKRYTLLPPAYPEYKRTAGVIFMARIIIDSGHGGSDPGATYEGRREKDDNLRLALAVGRILEENGEDVVYTRTEDVYQTPFEKAQLAISWEEIFSSPFTGIPVRRPTSIQGWRHWFTTGPAKSLRWRKPSTGSWRRWAFRILE